METLSNKYTVGQVLVCDVAFTTPTGVHFPKGSRFTVNLAGVSTRCHAERCGSIVWISDGCFLTNR